TPSSRLQFRPPLPPRSWMKSVRIAVGSTRKPKLSAVQEALAQFASLLAPETPIEVVGIEVDSGVGHTPTSREELMRGARQRVQALARIAKEKNETWEYLVGMEGGFDVIKENGSRRVFLESWAYASDARHGYYGRSGGVEV